MTNFGLLIFLWYHHLGTLYMFQLIDLLLENFLYVPYTNQHSVLTLGPPGMKFKSYIQDDIFMAHPIYIEFSTEFPYLQVYS